MDSRVFGTCRVTFDDRYAPVYITTWRGTTTLEGAKWGIEQQRLATAAMWGERRRVVTIADATMVERPPAEVRKYFAQTTDEQAASGLQERRLRPTSCSRARSCVGS